MLLQSFNTVAAMFFSVITLLVSITLWVHNSPIRDRSRQPRLGACPSLSQPCRVDRPLPLASPEQSQSWAPRGPLPGAWESDRTSLSDCVCLDISVSAGTWAPLGRTGLPANICIFYPGTCQRSVNIVQSWLREVVAMQHCTMCHRIVPLKMAEMVNVYILPQ